MAEALHAPLEQVGGKAASLARLSARRVPVPAFFVVPSDALQRHLEHNRITWPAVDDRPHPETLAGLRRQIAQAPIPEEVAGLILEGYASLTAEAENDVVAVRSSGADEDSIGASFAGQYSSMLGVSGGAKLLGALRTVWSSCLSEDVLAYRRARDIELRPRAGFGVLIQSQIFAEKAGVLFTRHPLEPEGDSAYLEANYGTGESVVGGTVTPDSITVSRTTGKIVESRIGSKRRMTVVSKTGEGSQTLETDPARRKLAVLSDSEAEGIVSVCLDIEELMGQPQDIEWAIDGRGLWILQARPQTARPE